MRDEIDNIRFEDRLRLYVNEPEPTGFKPAVFICFMLLIGLASAIIAMAAIFGLPTFYFVVTVSQMNQD